MGKAYIELKKNFKPKTGLLGGKPSRTQEIEQLLAARPKLLKQAYQSLTEDDKKAVEKGGKAVLKKWRENKPLRAEKERVRKEKTGQRRIKVEKREAQERGQLEVQKPLEEFIAQILPGEDVSVLRLIDESLYQCISAALENGGQKQEVKRWLEKFTFGWDSSKKDEINEKAKVLREKRDELWSRLREDLAPEWSVEGALKKIENYERSGDVQQFNRQMAKNLLELFNYLNTNNITVPEENSSLKSMIKVMQGVETDGERAEKVLKWLQDFPLPELKNNINAIKSVLREERLHKHKGANLSYDVVSRIGYGLETMTHRLRGYLR